MSIIKERKTEGRKINRTIRKAKNIFIMAHRNLDLDALGSYIGMYLFLKHRRKKCYIIIDDTEIRLMTIDEKKVKSIEIK